ncbi:50S ribosomal protein L5 [Rubripirellula reticaptiva]|uniref:Large ribosomal subunit protein uL5 n=1 Tax=Rubripirellula reticaptiva TaxID=2528013 RepID=A0A5C6ENI0_9BACT|nr:50S ribosomal protein L5 [Rubripirellula reticaptiva]TWU49657.1 50S ribosomal protein L5 [Rubripirellula reticaptiva]
MSEKPRMQVRYEDTIRKAMVEKNGYKNPHQIPRLEKITLNMGVGQAIGDKKILDLAYEAMTEIAGQKPVTTLARKSIANFRLREGMPIGCMVTIRRQRMYEFMDRLVSIVLPRVRDFRGINRKAFDGRGNYTLGLTELLVFPELNPDKFTRPQGMNITIVTSAKTNDEARELLTLFGMPFKAEKKASGAA